MVNLTYDIINTTYSIKHMTWYQCYVVGKRTYDALLETYGNIIKYTISL